MNTKVQFTSRAVVLLIASIGFTMLASGCGRSSSNPNRDDASRIQLALNWFPDAQHGGFYAADVSGRFAAAGIDVNLVPGGPGAPVIQNVALGRQEFGVGNADQILMARAQGAAIVAVFATMQTSPRCIMTHSKSGIRTFDELRNVKLALGTGKAFAKFLEQQVPLTGVTIVPYAGSIAPFLNDKRMAQQAYLFSEPVWVRQQGVEPTTLMVADLGFNPYSSCLFTSEDLIRDRPQLVRHVVQAVREGWNDYFQNPGPVHDRIVRDNPKVQRVNLDAAVDALAPLCLVGTPPNPNMLGMMQAERWETLNQQLEQLDLLPPGNDWNSAFTTQFLESGVMTSQ